MPNTSVSVSSSRQASNLTAVRLVVQGKLFGTSLEALRENAERATPGGYIHKLVSYAEHNPGKDLVLDRDRQSAAYPFVIKYLNLGTAQHITCIPEVIKEANYLGLEDLASKAASGNFFGWRSQEQLAIHGVFSSEPVPRHRRASEGLCNDAVVVSPLPLQKSVSSPEHRPSRRNSMPDLSSSSVLAHMRSAASTPRAAERRAGS